MKRKTVIEIAILAGVFAFFLGGLVSVKKEIVQMALTATVSGTVVFFMTYLLIIGVYGRRIKDDFPEEAGQQDAKNKGKKLDVTLKDTDDFNDIYNLGNK